MANVLDDVDGQFIVLSNDQDQLSLWPEAIKVPAGWQVKFGPDNRRACLDMIETTWTDMRPRELAEAMARNS